LIWHPAGAAALREIFNKLPDLQNRRVVIVEHIPFRVRGERDEQLVVRGEKGEVW
jgi:chemotaxis response regulator CheB